MMVKSPKGNKFDNVILDIEKLFSEMDFPNSSLKPRLTLSAVVQRYCVGLSYFLGIHERLILAHILLDWFYEFQDYWVNCLGHRPISVHDFHYLRNEYRKRYQQVEILGDDKEAHLKSWQDYRNIYSIFGAVWNSAFSELISYRYAKYIKRGASVCEFGCGIAPITQSLLKFYPGKKINFCVADIKQFTFHYAMWRYRYNRSVECLVLDSADYDPLTDKKFDAIFICQVFEHLPRPLQTARYLLNRLKENGLFVFDYIASDGEGLDTKAGVNEREETLSFLSRNIECLEGKIDLNRQFGVIVARKRVAGK